jgi:fibronectin-binding autotransporter adhesin
MKHHHSIHRILAGPALALLSLVSGSQAATIIKSATGTDLTDGASWGGTAPGSGDVASWVSSSLGAGLTLGSSTSWGGIGVSGALGAIGVTGAGPLTLGSGGINMALSTVNLTLGTPITLGAGQSWNVGSGRTLTASGIISGTSVGLTKAGAGTLTLTGANTYDGTNTIFGGTLIADTATNATILNSASPLVFTSSGTFQYKGLAAQTRSQTVNGLTLGSGAATIDANNTGTSTTIDLRGTGGSLTITRSAGATVDFKATTGSFGTTAIVNTAQANDATGILGAWATVNTGADWAINNGSGVAAAYTGYTTLAGTTLASTGTVNYRVASNPTTPTGNITMAATGTIDANSLRISDAAARTIDVRNGATQGILRLSAVGGLLTSGGNHIIGVSGTGTGGTITAGGAADTTGELIVNNSSNVTINSVIANNGTGVVSLTKSGTGTLFIGSGTNTGINTHTGNTTINAGTVVYNGPNNDTARAGFLGVNNSKIVTVNQGAVLGFQGVALTGSQLILNGGMLRNDFGGGNPSWTGSVILNANSFSDNTGNGGVVTTINGNISGVGGLTRTSATGTAQVALLLNGTNTYTGPTIITSGTVQFSKPAALYNAVETDWVPANLTVSSGGTLRVSVGGTGEFTTGQFGTLFSQLTTNVNDNGLKAGSAIGLDINNASAATITISANLADSTGTGGGAVGLKGYGSSAKTLELTGASTYSGPTSIDNDATLKVSSLNSVATNVGLGTVQSASSNLGRPTSIANGTISLGTGRTFKGATLLYTGTGETTDRVLNMGGGGNETYRLDQSGTGLLKFTSNMSMTDTRGPKTIVLQGSSAGTGEMAGVIPNATSATLTTAVTKSGTGTWTLSAANIYVGVTTASGGALVLNHATALPGGIGVSGGTSALTFNGGVIGLGAGDFTRSLATAGNVTGVNFTNHGGWAAYGADRAVNLGGASATVAWATANTGLNGKTLILGSATATHTVDFQNPLDMGAATRTVQVDDGTAAIDGKLSGSLTNGNLTKTGTGTLVLTGSNNYAGATTLSAGTLLVNGSNSGAGLITVASGATLGGTGSIAGASTFSSGAKAVFTVTRDPVTQANTTPLTIAGVMSFDSTEIHLNLPANLPSGVYTLATSSATPTGTVTATPVVDSGSYAAGFTSAVVSLDTVNNKLLLTVNGLPTSPTTLAVTSINGGLSPFAGVGFSVVVQAQDANGATRQALANTDVSLSLNTGSGPLGGTLTGTIPAGSVSVTISGVTYGTAQSGVVLTATRTSGDSLTSANSAPFTVLPSTAPAYLTVTGFPSPQSAGVAGSVTVTAKTALGATATTYTGTVAFTSSAVSAGLPANYSFVGSDNGVRVFTGVTLNTAGTQTITATDTVTSSITGTQSAITITPAAASSFVVSGYPNPRVVGLADSVTVTAKDVYGNTDTAYVGTVQLTSSDGAAILPANHTFTGGDNGVYGFSSVTLNTLGVQSITATDTVTASITGTQSGITVWIPPTNFTWRSPAVTGNWSDATKWAQASGFDYAPITTGQSDYVLNFITGTYAATQNLSAGFLANQLNFAGTVTIDGGNDLSLTNNGATLPTVNQNSSNTVIVNPPINLAANTTFAGSGNGQVDLTGLISGGGSLTKDGSSTLRIYNVNNSFSGGTIIKNGTLFGDINAKLGAGPITLDGGTLYMWRFKPTNALTVNGGSITSENGFNENLLAGPITLNATLPINAQFQLTCSNTLSGVGGLTKTGGGLVILSNTSTSTYTGPTSVSDGTLRIDRPEALSGGSALSVSGTGKLNLNYAGTKTVASLTLGGVPKTTAGTYGSVASLATFPSDTYFTPGSTGTVTIGTDYDTWLTEFTFAPGADKTATGDPDGDGMNNQEEYAFGLNPTLGSSVNPIITPLNPATGNFQYTRRATPAASKLTYTVLTSTDLAVWAAGGATETSFTTAGNIQTVAVNVTASPVGGKLFVRVEAAPTP